MPLNSMPPATTIDFSTDELDLLADAIALLWIKPARRERCLKLATNHPELGLFYGGSEPESEEDR